MGWPQKRRAEDMESKRIFFIAGGIVLAVLLLLGSGLSAPEFGIVMLGGAAITAVAMYLITRRRNKSPRLDQDNIKPPKL
jgi:hypothetical protein